MNRFVPCLAVILIMLAEPPAASRAQTAATQSASPFVPVATPTLDPKVLEVPKPTEAQGAAKPAIDKTGKALPPPSLPNKVDLGGYDLEFKAGRARDVNPRTGLDSGETTNLSNMKGRNESVLPNYFGLKLSTPTK